MKNVENNDDYELLTGTKRKGQKINCFLALVNHHSPVTRNNGSKNDQLTSKTPIYLISDIGTVGKIFN
jgi:hypothetical protein